MRTRMFDSYNDFSSEYIPDNIHFQCHSNESYSMVSNDPLHKLINNDGKFYGYWWNYGDTVNIDLTVNIPIFIEKYAVIYDQAGAEPGLKCPGFVGQRAYNVVDLKSWTMRNYVDEDDLYMWIQDDVFTYPNSGEIQIYCMPNMNNKTICVEILNFRRENILSYYFKEVNSCVLNIDKESSSKLKHGIYYMLIHILSDEKSKQVDYYEIQVR